MSRRKIILLLMILAIVSITLYCGYNLTPKNAAYFLSKRIPRMMAMLLVSFAIVGATLIFQTMTQNHILTPDLLGYSQLYTLVQTVLVFVLGGTHYLIVNKTSNFLIVSGLMLLFSYLLYSVLLRRFSRNLFLLLLIGSIFSTLFRSVTTYFQLIIDPNEFTILQNKLIASFTTINTQILVISLLLLSLGFIWIIRNLHVLDVLSLGHDQAVNLGVDVQVFHKKALVVISVLISISTALVGPITFLGLIAVNGARFLMKTYRHTYLLICAVFMGIVLLVGGQFLIERIFSYTVSLTVLLNLLGGVYVLYLILKEKVL